VCLADPADPCWPSEFGPQRPSSPMGTGCDFRPEPKPDLVFSSSMCQAPPGSTAPTPCRQSASRCCGTEWGESRAPEVRSVPDPREKVSISHHEADAPAITESLRRTPHRPDDPGRTPHACSPCECTASQVLQPSVRSKGCSTPPPLRATSSPPPVPWDAGALVSLRSRSTSPSSPGAS
jgi:hypothetical protein